MMWPMFTMKTLNLPFQKSVIIHFKTFECGSFLTTCSSEPVKYAWWWLVHGSVLQWNYLYNQCLIGTDASMSLYLSQTWNIACKIFYLLPLCDPCLPWKPWIFRFKSLSSFTLMNWWLCIWCLAYTVSFYRYCSQHHYMQLGWHEGTHSSL